MINVYTDHQNNTRPTTAHQSKRLQRWRWHIEEFGPTIRWLEGKGNEVADHLSRAEMEENCHYYELNSIESEELLNMEELGDKALNEFPLSAKMIRAEQDKDATLSKAMRHPKTAKHFSKTVEGMQLYMVHDKIYVPESLKMRILYWYHWMLGHPGSTRTELTLRQHFYWPGMTKDIRAFVQRCHTCQVKKSCKRSYGHLPERDLPETPWHDVCVDLIGPYDLKDSSGAEYTLKATTMSDPFTGWFEVVEIPNKKAITAASLFDWTF